MFTLTFSSPILLLLNVVEPILNFYTMIKNHFFLLYMCFLLPIYSFGQEESEKNWVLSGYIKDLQSLFMLNNQAPLPDILIQDNLLHHRLNFRWYPNERWTIRAELRNRIFWGDQIKLSGADDFLVQIDRANDFLDLSWGKANDKGLGFHTMIDRLYVDYTQGNWEIRLGRQRINWGINTIWNPNDIFNAFSFTDFDYEERPGSDAARIKYYTGAASSVEIAIKAFDQIDSMTAAALWKFNKWNYDFQVLGGVVHQDLVLGAGWAGSIKNAGLKGELAWFYALEGIHSNSFAATFGIDYSFANSLYSGFGFLYNSNGSSTTNINNLFTFELSAKNLYPYPYAIFLQSSYPISPLLNAVLAIIYSPSKSQATFLNPSLTYSIKENWDLDLIGQFVFNKEEKIGHPDKKLFRSPVQGLFLRFKFSY